MSLLFAHIINRVAYSIAKCKISRQIVHTIKSETESLSRLRVVSSLMSENFIYLIFSLQNGPGKTLLKYGLSAQSFSPWEAKIFSATDRGINSICFLLILIVPLQPVVMKTNASILNNDLIKYLFLLIVSINPFTAFPLIVYLNEENRIWKIFWLGPVSISPLKIINLCP